MHLVVRPYGHDLHAIQLLFLLEGEDWINAGGAARMSRKAGGKFTAWGGQLEGKNLMIVPKRMIVQSWRGTHWKKSDPDSILILEFSKTPRGGRVDMVHANVPEHDHKGVTEGWHQYYWRPWKAYLARKRKA